MVPKTQETEEKMNKGTSWNLKKFMHQKNINRKKNQLTEQEKIFAMQVSDKRLRSSMYRELLKCNKTTDKT